MSAPKFTPGPWTVFDTHPARACFYIDHRDVVGSFGGVAVIYGTADDTHRANARIIAAAPDLYAALVTLREWMNSGPAARPDLVTVIDTALAKVSE